MGKMKKKHHGKKVKSAMKPTHLTPHARSVRRPKKPQEKHRRMHIVRVPISVECKSSLQSHKRLYDTRTLADTILAVLRASGIN